MDSRASAEWTLAMAEHSALALAAAASSPATPPVVCRPLSVAPNAPSEGVLERRG